LAGLNLGLTPERLLRCYALGCFPMADDRDDPDIYLVDPEERGILPLDSFHVSRSLRKAVRRAPFELRVDSDFRQVIEACAAPSAVRDRSWLNAGLIDLYCALHEAGHAHSVESWRDGQLVGGLYGVSLGAAFFGESMFSRATDASKVALVELVGRLRAGGYQLLDTQFVTDHLASFGAVAIPRIDYRRMLRRALEQPRSFPTEPQGFAPLVVGEGPAAGGGAGSGSSQPITQTS
jgi:leucyl/phenylalanyl-tRNA--protein transferase